MKWLLIIVFSTPLAAQINDPLPFQASVSWSGPWYVGNAPIAGSTIGYEVIRYPAFTPMPFLQNKINRQLVSTEFSTRLMDGHTTRMNVADPCRCIKEVGTFYGMFSLQPIAAHAWSQYAYSAVMAGGNVGVSMAVWHRAERVKRHRKVWETTARLVMGSDIVVNAVAGVASNIIARKEAKRYE